MASKTPEGSIVINITINTCLCFSFFYKLLAKGGASPPFFENPVYLATHNKKKQYLRILDLMYDFIIMILNFSEIENSCAENVFHRTQKFSSSPNRCVFCPRSHAPPPLVISSGYGLDSLYSITRNINAQLNF